MLMCLDTFVFGLNTAAYESFQRSLAWRHPATSRVGARPGHQFLGPDDESIKIAGTVRADITPNGSASLSRLEKMAATGAPYLLAGGDARIYGWFVIESMESTGTAFFPNGTPRKIDFTLNLKRVDAKLGMLVPNIGLRSFL